MPRENRNMQEYENVILTLMVEEKRNVRFEKKSDFAKSNTTILSRRNNRRQDKTAAKIAVERKADLRSMQ